MIRTPAPVTSRAVLSTSRICACTVTSSAVVGSSQISRSGSFAIAIAMTTRCRSPPDSSCGNDRVRCSGWAMPTSSSSSTARARAALPGDTALVDLDRFRDLVADGVDGGERRHRVLEHRADDLAADRGHPLVRQPDQLVAVQPDRSGHLGIFGQQADNGHRAGRLARTRLADDGHDLARIDVKVHTAHGIHRCGIGREGDGRGRSPRAGSFAAPPQRPGAGIESVAQAVADEVGAQNDQAPAHRRETETATGTSSPTWCRRRSAYRATHRAAGCRNPGSSARFRRARPCRRSVRCR